MTAILTPDEFRDRTRAAILAQHPDWTLVDVADDHGPGLRADFPDGSGMICYLTNAYGHYQHGQPADQAIRDLLAGLRPIVNADAFARYRDDYTNAREHLMVQLSRAHNDADQEPPNRRVAVPWQGGLVLYPALDLAESLSPVLAHQLATWQVGLDAVMTTAVARTRAALAATTGRGTVIRLTAGLTLTIWDNDLPGYTATRAAWPDLALPSVPTGNGYGLVCAPDRDYCVSLLIADIGHPRTAAASATFASVVKRRAGYPRPLMAPGIVFARADGSYTYQPLDLPQEPA